VTGEDEYSRYNYRRYIYPIVILKSTRVAGIYPIVILKSTQVAGIYPIVILKSTQVTVTVFLITRFSSHPKRCLFHSSVAQIPNSPKKQAFIR
jgi:hypothetical protein